LGIGKPKVKRDVTPAPTYQRQISYFAAKSAAAAGLDRPPREIPAEMPQI
jgi:hypothetical protein